MPDVSARVARMPFGVTREGSPVDAFTVTNRRGVELRAMSYGATIVSLRVPDRDGNIDDIVLGYDDLAGYLHDSSYFGAIVGRYGNRIARGRFTLDGEDFQVPVNNGPNALHGGTAGFDKVNWEVVEVREGPDAGVTLRHVSPHMDQGFPGTLTATAVYTLDEGDTLGVEYRAETDRPTVVNLSNHAYWNLAGEGSAEGAMGHLLTIPADRYCPTDAAAIPTGEFRAVDGTPFEFRRPVAVGARVRDASDPQIVHGKGYDHNWVLAREVAKSPRLVARVEDPSSGRVMEVLSDQPGLQFYSGNFLDGAIAGKAGRLYRQGDAVVLEPQMFPDTPNRPEFGSVRLDPGETYLSRILFRFSTDADR